MLKHFGIFKNSIFDTIDFDLDLGLLAEMLFIFSAKSNQHVMEFLSRIRFSIDMAPSICELDVRVQMIIKADNPNAEMNSCSFENGICMCFDKILE